MHFTAISDNRPKVISSVFKISLLSSFLIISFLAFLYFPSSVPKAEATSIFRGTCTSNVTSTGDTSCFIPSVVSGDHLVFLLSDDANGNVQGGTGSTPAGCSTTHAFCVDTAGATFEFPNALLNSGCTISASDVTTAVVSLHLTHTGNLTVYVNFATLLPTLNKAFLAVWVVKNATIVSTTNYQSPTAGAACTSSPNTPSVTILEAASSFYVHAMSNDITHTNPSIDMTQLTIGGQVFSPGAVSGANRGYVGGTAFVFNLGSTSTISAGVITQTFTSTSQDTQTSTNGGTTYIIIHPTTLTFTRTSTNNFFSTILTTVNTTRTATAVVAPSTSNPQYWIFGFVALLLPVGLFTSLIFEQGHRSGNPVEPNAVIFAIVSGLLVGSVIGLLLNVIPWGITALFVVVFFLYLWRGRGS